MLIFPKNTSEKKTCEVAVRKTDNVVLAQRIQEQVNLKRNRKQNGWCSYRPVFFHTLIAKTHFIMTKTIKLSLESAHII